MSEPEDDPQGSSRGHDAPEVADPEFLPEVPAAEEQTVAEVYQQRARLAEDRLAEVLKGAKIFPIDDAYAGANRKRVVDRWINEVLRAPK